MREFLLIAGIHFLAVSSPGINLALVIRNSLTYTRRAGVWVALGLALGDAVHIVYSAVGLGLLLVHSPAIFTAFKWVGAGYLVYIGIRALMTKPPLSPGAAAKAGESNLPVSGRQLPPLKAIRMGFLADLLNPKASLFFLALFTQVIHPDASPALKLLYGGEMTIMSFAWFAFVAVLLTHGRLQRAVGRHRHHVDRAFGVVLVIFGVGVMLH